MRATRQSSCSQLIVTVMRVPSEALMRTKRTPS
jgi:hypothetical protein